MGLIRTAAMIGFLVAMTGALWLITKVLDERRGRQLSSLQVLLNPFMISREQLTEQGRRWHAWFLKVWSVGFGFWVIALLSMVFSR